MSYCLNPDCQKPQNPNATKFCQSCGTKLVLAERYRAIKLIGAGGFGRTLLAEDEYKPSKPQCVIKQFYPQGQNNAGKAAELFQQEAVRLEQLGKHPQIPELFAHFEQDSRQYIVQEFIDGQNLAEELAEKGVFREKQIHSLLGDLLPVVQFIHQGQVIHRDIKPENIIRRRSDGKLVLVDFGAAKYATGTALGKTGTTIGSAGYAAPEQTFGQAVFASDIYGLGVTCIHLLTDIEPFELYNAMESAFVWWYHLGNNLVSDQLGRVLDKMTQSVVKHRYKTASAVMQALGLKVEMQTSKNKPRPQINCKVIQPSTPAVGTQSGTPAPVLKPISPAKASTATTVQIVNPKVSQTVNPKAASAPSSPLPSPAKASSPAPGQAASPKITSAPVPTPPKSAKLNPPSTFTYSIKIDPANVSLLTTLSGSKGEIYSVAFSPDGQKLASDSRVFGWFLGKDANTVRIWNINSGELVYTLKRHSRWVRCVAFSSDGQILASGSDDRTIKLWDAFTGKEIRTITSHSGSINSIAFSPDGQTLSSCSDKTIKLWDVHTGQEKSTLEGHLKHSNLINSIAFSHDGQTIAISSAANTTIKLWNGRIGWEKHSLEGHSNGIHSVAFSRDGLTLASGSLDKTIKLWNVSTGKEKRTLEGHSRAVTSVAFSRDGLTLASSSSDKTVKLWDVYTGQEIGTLNGHSDSVNAVAFSPDGQTLASGSSDKNIKIWRVIC